MDFWQIGLLAAALLCVLFHGGLSCMEIALISADRTALNQAAERGDMGARRALNLRQDSSRFLPAVQFVTAFLETMTAVLATTVTLSLAGPLFEHIEPGLPRNAALLTVLFLTVVGSAAISVAVGEFLPQQLAQRLPPATATAAAGALEFLGRVLRPLVRIISRVTELVAQFAGPARATRPVTSRQEIRHLIELGMAEGVVGVVEQRLAFEALQLGERTTRQIMKPRIDIDALDVATPAAELLGTISMAGFSRLPVYEGDLDHIIGFVHLKDVLRQHYLGWQLDLRKLIRPALTVPDTLRLDKLLVRFQEQRNQLAIVVDEFGATRGMVTLEDVLEELVGELLTDHHERVEQQIVRRDQKSWLVHGAVSIADMLEYVGLPGRLDSAPRNVSSVAGLVLELMGRLPRAGEKVAWHELQVEVVDLDGRRIDQVLVTVQDPQTS